MQQLPKPLARTAGPTAGEPAVQQAQRSFPENKKNRAKDAAEEQHEGKQHQSVRKESGCLSDNAAQSAVMSALIRHHVSAAEREEE